VSPIKTFIARHLHRHAAVRGVVFGLVSWPRIGVDNMPNVDVPVITVTTILPGADPETVERNVSKELEEELNTISGLDSIQSQNYESVSLVILQFDLEVPLETAANDVREKVQAAVAKLPREAEAPIVQKVTSGRSHRAARGLGPLPIAELTRVAEDELKPALQRFQGVGSIDVIGGRKRRARRGRRSEPPARPRPRHHRRLPGHLRAVDRHPGGRTNEPTVERVIKLETEAASVEELRDLVIAAPQGSRSASATSPTWSTARGGPVDRQPGREERRRPPRAEAVRGQHRRGRGAGEGGPPRAPRAAAGGGARRGRGGQRALHPQLHQLGPGGHDHRRPPGGAGGPRLPPGLASTIVSAVALPTSIIGTFAAMRALDFTFNNVTMLALTLSIGLLIDDAIVVIENIVRRLEKGEPPPARRSTGPARSPSRSSP